MTYKFLFFDVAGTLLYKKCLYTTIVSTLANFGIKTQVDEVKRRHKLLSEVIPFPKKTTEKFYNYFNSELLYVLGIIPTKKILTSIYKNCRSLPWTKYPDTRVLNKLIMPMGIISNWDTNLNQIVKTEFSIQFSYIIESTTKESKPNLSFYKNAFKTVNVPFANILYVGDSLKLDIKPAVSMGVTAILIDRDNLYPYFKGEKITTLYDIDDYI